MGWSRVLMAMYDEDGDGKLSPVELQIAVEALVQVLFSFDNSAEIFGADVSITERGVSSTSNSRRRRRVSFDPLPRTAGAPNARPNGTACMPTRA